MVELAELENIQNIGLPKIGAGLGGLDWQQVKSMLIEIGKNTSVDLIVYENFLKEPTNSGMLDSKSGSERG